MKILVLSDIIFYPFEKQIAKLSNGWNINSEFYDDLPLALLKLDEKKIKKFDYIFIHSDQLFHKKDKGWHKLFFNSLMLLFDKYTNNKFILSNMWYNSYTFMELNSSLGRLNDTHQLYLPEINKISDKANCYVLDVIDMIFNIGLINSYNYSLGVLYQMPYTKKLIELFSAQLVGFISFLEEDEKKVIILDCDNTLWGGIVGEDGIHGIKCDKNSDGYLYYQFQLFLRERKNDGFLLCLCSKNNIEDVKKAFYTKNMPLKWEDFIIKKVNWNKKFESIREIAAELNLGLESFIFIDDNQYEIELVKSFTSVKTSFLFRNEISYFFKFTDNFCFRRKKILQSDREKTKQYELETIRKIEKSQLDSFEDFINNLNIKIDIRYNDIEDFERLSQLTEKTNQFNFNKKVFTKNNLIAWIDNGNDVYSIKVSDKYGDYGTVGLILVRVIKDTITIENFIMSCRALGKQVEKKFFDFVLNSYNQKGISLSRIFFKETNKNKPAKIFLKESNYDNFIRTVK